MPRVLHATNILIEAQIWIKAHYPYWKRNGGRDHIWVRARWRGRAGHGITARLLPENTRHGPLSQRMPLPRGSHSGNCAWGGGRGRGGGAWPISSPSPLSRPRPPTAAQMVTHDEGSCWVPKSIKNSTILSFWGRTEPNHVSVTGYRAWGCRVAPLCSEQGRGAAGGCLRGERAPRRCGARERDPPPTNPPQAPTTIPRTSCTRCTSPRAPLRRSAPSHATTLPRVSWRRRLLLGLHVPWRC